MMHEMKQFNQSLETMKWLLENGTKASLDALHAREHERVERETSWHFNNPVGCKLCGCRRQAECFDGIEGRALSVIKYAPCACIGGGRWFDTEPALAMQLAEVFMCAGPAA